MRINQNISAMNTYSRLTAANTSKSNSLARLSSGLRINKAGDDAAGLAISEKMRGQVSGLNQAVRNAQDGISLIQTAEGALNETHSILQRMRELAVQSSNDTNTPEDRIEIQKEMDQLSTEITRIGNDTQFNTQELLNGDFANKTFHIGANEGQSTKLSIADMRANKLEVEGNGYEASTTIGDLKFEAAVVGEAGNAYEIELVTVSAETTTIGVAVTDNKITVTLQSADTSTVSTSKASDIVTAISGHAGASALVSASVTGADAASIAANEAKVQGTATVTKLTGGAEVESTGIDVSSTQGAANDAIKTIDDAISKVSAERSKLGATQNRLDHTINNLTATSENLSAAESRIRDVDMAQEMMEFTKNNILSQAATSMLAQANQMPQSVLQLLQ